MEATKMKNVHVIKLIEGEDVISTLNNYVAKEQIGFGTIQGIGKLTNIKIGFLKNQRKYVEKIINEAELISFLGNISWEDANPLIHVHVALGLADFSVTGGHLINATIGAVGEVFITELNKDKVMKISNSDSSLKTWNI